VIRPARILAVDDNPEILSVLRRGLVRRGYDVSTAPDGRSALAAFHREAPDLVLLDLRLPDVDGLDLCGELRDVRDVPVIMLTARDTLDEKVEGLRAGADDYVVKPFALEELIARIEAVLRRRPPGEATIAYEDVAIDIDGRRVSRAGEELHLTRTEFAILEMLARHAGRVISRQGLATAVWPDAEFVEDGVIDSHVNNLRRKLEAGGRRRLVQNVRGLGFVLR
jgi:DNA-binding response OmpR family regulator